MAKKIKNKHIQRIMSVLSVALTLSLVFVISCSATDTFTNYSKVTNPDYLISRAVVNNPRDFGVNSGTQFVLDNYNSIGLNTTVANFHNVKYTGYINYPFNDVTDGYNSNGRLWASFLNVYDVADGDFTAPTDDQSIIATYACISPETSLTAPSQTPNRCTLGGRSVDLFFDDIEYVHNPSNPAHDSMFAFGSILVCTPETIDNGYLYLKATVTYTVLYDNALDNSNRLYVKDATFTQYVPYNYTTSNDGLMYCTARHNVATWNKLLREVDAGTNEAVITDLHINYDYLVDSNGNTAGNANYRVVQASTQSTVDDDKIFIDVSDVNNYEDNALANLLTKTKIYIVEGLGNVSFTDWLENAVGGFFDFEIVPNISLGGILLVVLSVGLFMLIIRIFKG